MGESEDEEISSDSNEFLRFVEDGDKTLYPGCTKTTKLNCLIQTFNLKAKHGMTDACYSDMLVMIGMLLPEGNEVPGSLYEAKKTLAALGMEYERIHACPNDCMLYRGQHSEATSCLICGESRWKLGRDKVEKKGVPGKGVEGVYDAVREESFTLKAVLLWTINDFPAYGNLSGSIIKGYNACPICVDETRPYRLKHSKKMAFMRHRRFLPRHHPYRKQAAAFDNTIEEDVAPSPLSGEEVLSRVELRHILDVMHIEKNCCDAIIGTLLNIPGKTKDGGASRLDMVDMGIRTDLKPTPGPKRPSCL
ncbi:uncharacterized protein LOC112201810 [Rosa chinensis]|uniref:uncharacterized protein LOC112201810 n=1 Tax=Rosa chinensis TaxID=74649 RepID=UPI000D088E42|nr:uncharacterized protein LOC112201810 [Rosa chinensis]